MSQSDEDFQLILKTFEINKNTILDEIKKVIPVEIPSSTSISSSTDISNGLKEALNNGITKQVWY